MPLFVLLKLLFQLSPIVLYPNLLMMENSVIFLNLKFSLDIKPFFQLLLRNTVLITKVLSQSYFFREL